MIYSVVGYYSLILGLISGSILIYFSIQNFRNSEILDTKILSLSFLQLLFVCPLVDDHFLNVFPVSAMMVQTKGSPKPTQVTLLQTVLKSHQGPALDNK